MYCRRRGEKGACSARSKKHTQVPAERAPKLSEGGGCLDFATGLSSLLLAAATHIGHDDGSYGGGALLSARSKYFHKTEKSIPWRPFVRKRVVSPRPNSSRTPPLAKT